MTESFIATYHSAPSCGPFTVSIKRNRSSSNVTVCVPFISCHNSSVIKINGLRPLISRVIDPSSHRKYLLSLTGILMLLLSVELWPVRCSQDDRPRQAARHLSVSASRAPVDAGSEHP